MEADESVDDRAKKISLKVERYRKIALAAVGFYIGSFLLPKPRIFDLRTHSLALFLYSFPL